MPSVALNLSQRIYVNQGHYMKCTKLCFLVLVTYSSAVTWQLTLTGPGKQVQGQKDLGQSKDINAHDGDLCILISGSLNSEKPVSIFFFNYETIILTSFNLLSMLIMRISLPVSINCSKLNS